MDQKFFKFQGNDGREERIEMSQKEFLLEEKRYRSNFHSLGQKFFKFQGNDGREESVEMPQKRIKLVTNV